MTAPAEWPPAADRILDATGLRCPLPVLKLEAALRTLPPGATVAIRTDDPIALLDVPHAAREGGHDCARLGGAEAGPNAAAATCVFVVTRRGEDGPKRDA